MKKSTLIKSHELDRYLEIRELVKEYPNDMELGGKVRALFWKSKPHYPSKEMRDSWNESQS
mgnify:FL=1|jgi:hypothetical protein